MTLTVAPEPLSLPTLPAAQAWSSLALCKGKTDIFFGPAGERPSKRRKRETLARSYCKVCPVADPCREAGRAGRENGVWGDEDEEERARAGWTPIATERRAVARAAREAREAQVALHDSDEHDDADDLAQSA